MRRYRHYRKTRFRKRASLLLAVVLGASALYLAVGPAQAVHDSGSVELDGGTAGANLRKDSAGTADPQDWASMFNPDGSVRTLPAGTSASSFLNDTATATGDHSYFLPSTKDDETINPAGGSSVWGCRDVANPTDKDEILHAYSVAVTAPTGPYAGDLVLYTGGERFANNGSAFYGVWFFQKNVGCTAPTKGSAKFGTTKTNGDILLLVNFDQGGRSVVLDAFAWHPCNAPPTPLPANKCGDPTLDAGYFSPAVLAQTGGVIGGDCGAVPQSPDVACATVNRKSIPTTWATQDKTSPANTLAVSEFFESGLNITKAFNLKQGEEPCFSSYLLETRSSNTIDATLKDFAAGSLPTCGGLKAHKYNDLNVNGAKDANEPSLQGWTLFIDKDNDAVLDTGERSGVTNASGTVDFGTELKVGTYRVCEVLKANWINSDPGGTAPCKTVTVVLNQVTTVEFGNYQQGAIRVNKVSIKGNTPLALVEFAVKKAGVLVTTLKTDTNGTACVAGLNFGVYTVTETKAPAGYKIDNPNPVSVTVDHNATCSSVALPNTPPTFTDTPLSEITV
jgi:hypothetical protein